MEKQEKQKYQQNFISSLRTLHVFLNTIAVVLVAVYKFCVKIKLLPKLYRYLPENNCFCLPTKRRKPIKFTIYCRAIFEKKKKQIEPIA